MSGYFVTGTDTGIGKTWSTLALMQHFKNQGKTVLGMKPVASGCERIDGQWKNEDALLIQEQGSIVTDYQEINPYAFEWPVSPNIAADKAGAEIDLESIARNYAQLKAKADIVIVEGVGGWRVPLNAHQDVASLAEQLNLPIIIVVGMRLGCINQAKLTFAAIQETGLKCHGWIASCVEPEMQALDENIQTLRQATDIPLLAIFPHAEKLDSQDLSLRIDKGIG